MGDGPWTGRSPRRSHPPAGRRAWPSPCPWCRTRCTARSRPSSCRSSWSGRRPCRPGARSQSCQRLRILTRRAPRPRPRPAGRSSANPRWVSTLRVAGGAEGAEGAHLVEVKRAEERCDEERLAGALAEPHPTARRCHPAGPSPRPVCPRLAAALAVSHRRGLLRRVQVHGPAACWAHHHVPALRLTSRLSPPCGPHHLARHPAGTGI